MAGTITISASFGAGGSIVGRRVAERLGLPFFDRAIPATVAQRLAIPMDEAEAQDERAPSAWQRLAQAFANVATPVGPQPVPSVPGAPRSFREETERFLRQTCESTGGVVLGRAGMIVLRDRPDVLRVRLDGPPEARLAQYLRFEDVDEQTARQLQRDVDRAREGYVRVFYHARQSDPRLYHLVIDSTAVSLATCTDLIVEAAQDLLARSLLSQNDSAAPL